ncbi:MAG: LysR family transcriptional regulator [Nakamurella sp.]
MDLDTVLLKAFVAVADELHFGRAARTLHLSQQALSKRISRLESQAGVRLFDRDRRNVTISSAGLRMLPHARRAIVAVDAALTAVRAERGPTRIDVLNEHLAPMQFLQKLSGERPDLHLEVISRESTRSVEEMLRTGAADVCLGRAGALTSPWPPDIHCKLALAERIELLVPHEHEWARRHQVGLAELSGQPLWFPMTGAPTEWTSLLDELSADFRLDIDYSGSTMGFQHWIERITQGDAPPSFIGSAMPTPPVPGLSRVALVDPTPVFAWTAMWRSRLIDDVVDTVIEPLQNHSRDDIAHLHDRTRRWIPRTDSAFHAGTSS